MDNTLNSFLIRNVDSGISKLIGKSFASLKIALLCSAFIFIVSFPDYIILKTERVASDRKIFVEKQILDPFDKELYKVVAPQSQESKRVFRILIPLIAQYTGLNYTGIILLQGIFGILFFALLFSFAKGITNSEITAAYFCIAFASIYAGKAFFTDIYAFFDPFAFFILLAGFSFPFLSVAMVSGIAGSFIDERFIIVFPLLFLHCALRKDQTLKSFLLVAVCFISTITVVLILRKFIFVHFGSDLPNLTSSNALVGTDLWRSRIGLTPFAIFTALEFLWVIFAVFIYEMYLRKDYIYAIAILSIALASIAAGLCVADTTRSISYIFPVILFALSYLGKNGLIEKYKDQIKLCCIGCLLFFSLILQGKEIFVNTPIVPKILQYVK